MTRFYVVLFIILGIIISGICVASANNKLPSIIDIADSIIENLTSSGADHGPHSPPPSVQASSSSSRSVPRPSESEFLSGFASEKFLISDSDMLGSIMASPSSQDGSTHFSRWESTQFPNHSGSTSSNHFGSTPRSFNGSWSGSGDSALSSGVSSSGGGSASGGSDGSGTSATNSQPLNLMPFLPTSPSTSPQTDSPQTDSPSQSDGGPVSSPLTSDVPLTELFGDNPSESEPSSGDVAATPEPGTMLLMGVGVAGAAFIRRRKAARNH